MNTNGMYHLHLRQEQIQTLHLNPKLNGLSRVSKCVSSSYLFV